MEFGYFQNEKKHQTSTSQADVYKTHIKHLIGFIQFG